LHAQAPAIHAQASRTPHSELTVRKPRLGTSSTRLGVPAPPSGGSKANKRSFQEGTPTCGECGRRGGGERGSCSRLEAKEAEARGKGDDIVDRELGEDAAWEHEVNSLELAFPEGYSYQKPLDAGLTSASVRKPLQSMPPEKLLGESYRLCCQSGACLQVGLESSLAAKTKAEEELLAARDQVAVLMAERDSALAYLPLQEKVDALTDQLSVKEGKHQSTLERVSRLEEDVKVSGDDLEVAGVLHGVGVVEPGQQSEATEQNLQPEKGKVVGDGGECPT
ncbi:hypothetical protein PIB30_073151, partial [Stylosanthes scabra]|nr:hypothetical protein [Stylosanthes scabra]